MKKKYRIAKYIVSSTLVLLLNNSLMAAPRIPVRSPGNLLPSSVLPERAATNFSTPAFEPTRTLPPAIRKQGPQPTLGPQAAKIQFKLEQVILSGNHVYSDETLSALYKDKLHTQITVAQLQDIVQHITNYYRNNGYILSRAILPPQRVNKGIVRITVLEGYIGHVSIMGTPKGAKPLLEAYGDKILQSRPLQVKVMEKYLLLANEVPGVQVKAVLEPSRTKTAASDLILVAQTKTLSGYASYDNYGTLYLGPLEVSAGGELDSIFLPGDTTQASFVAASRPQQMKFIQGTYGMPLGANGARFNVSGNQALTRPGLNLANPSLLIDGVANTFSGMLQYPLIRTRSSGLTTDGTFNYIDSRVVATPASLPLYTDHIRALRVGGTYNLSDSWYGTNAITAHAEHGFEMLGATPTGKADSGTVSRFGASGLYTKFDAQVSRLQQLGNTRYSLFINTGVQYSSVPLLASVQFSFGGVPQAMGRGYDPSEIIGDKGAGGSLELRANYAPGKQFLQTLQAYTFYDAGIIWNVKQIVDQKKEQSATSIGCGSRFFFTRYISGNLLIAQPLTRQVDALEVAGDNSKKPRIFFSITAAG